MFTIKKISMKNLFLFCFFVLSLPLFSQNNSSGWAVSSEPQKNFIENKSQFNGRNKLTNSKILYGIDQNGTQVYFTKQGLTYRFDERQKKDIREEEKEREKESKKMTAEEWAEHEKEERSVKINTDLVHLQWENANPNVQIVAENEATEYYSYCVGKENINHIKGYKKIIYKNLYPNIDVEYVFHQQDGIKYSLILHPGADASQVKMVYSNARNVSTDKKNNIHLSTMFGDIIDHSPKTFYSDNAISIIPSSFVKTGKTISFSLGNYDHTKTVVVDPWTQTPALANSNGVWECERDGAGNVYIIGGDSPMKLLKYNSAGVIQWTYSTPWDTANNWLGTLATDLAGNSYITSGSIAEMQKISPTGGLVWNSPAPLFSTDEYWTISFNCDQTMLVVGGTTGAGFPSMNLQGAIFNINTANGSVIGSPQIVGIMFNTIPPYINEVRSISPSYNGRYYYMTLDSMGCIDQNFSVCSNGAPIFAISNGYNLAYKCENYRTLGGSGGNAGVKTIKANKNFVYTTNGKSIQKRSLTTGAVISTATIPGGASTSSLGRNAISNGGIDIDTCGNVYVGSCNSVIKFDANLNLLSQFALSFNVYDVAVSTNGDVIVCGATGIYSTVSRTGSVQSIPNFAACNPLTLQCCDANICNAGPFCTTDPSVTLTPSSSGGTWSGTGITNTTTGTFNPSVAGTGTFTITYSLSCGSGSMQIVVKPCATMTVCVESNGDLSVSGGAGPYHWDVASTTLDCSSCPFGMCAPPICNGVTATTWNTYSTSTTATPPGTLPIRVVDNNGNILVINTLSGLPTCGPPSPMSATTTPNSPVCNGQCTGTATANQTGGTAPLTYSWNTSPVQTTQTATGLCNGNYGVLVTDASANTATATVSITQPSAIASTVTVTNTTCGANTGTAQVTASGGTGSLTYNWNPSGQNTSTATGLGAGNYSCTITDANGCTHVQASNISNSNGPTATTSVINNALCNGDSNGSASAAAAGGSSPYSYSWTNGQTTSATTGLSTGTYTVTVTDALGCSNTQTVSITAPAALTASVTNTPASCGHSDGTALVTAAGGTTSYTYSWSPTGGNSSSATGLAAGTYSVIVTDANGCSKTLTTAVTNSNGPTVVAGTSTTIAPGGSVALTSSGGVTYVWSPATGLSNPNISNPVAQPSVTTTYCVHVTDASGCSDSACVTINVESPCSDNFYLPNAFSPNGDGENDVLKIYPPDIARCIKEYTFTIYDRWGEIVFTTINPTASWDGMQNGKIMDTQVVVYYLHVIFIDGKEVNKKGNISLVR